MSKLVLTMALATLVVSAVLVPGAARAGVNVDVNIGVPPPPVISFPGPPQPVIIPQTQVYYVPEAPDYDLFRYGRFWYVNRGGYWYRARAYNGPFVQLDFARVPRAIVALPANYHRHPLHPPHVPHAPHQPHSPGHFKEHRAHDRHEDRR